MEQLEEYPEMLQVKELKDLLRIGLRQAYKLCKQEDFPSIRINGNSIRIPRHGLKQWLHDQMENSSAEDGSIDLENLKGSG